VEIAQYTTGKADMQDDDARDWAEDHRVKELYRTIERQRLRIEELERLLRYHELREVTDYGRVAKVDTAGVS